MQRRHATNLLHSQDQFSIFPGSVHSSRVELPVCLHLKRNVNECVDRSVSRARFQLSCTVTPIPPTYRAATSAYTCQCVLHGVYFPCTVRIARPAGLEPTTLYLEGRSSIH